MKAALCTAYGPPEVLQIRDVPDPVARDNGVVIRIRAAAVVASDVYMRSGLPNAPLISRIIVRVGIGFLRPRNPILGAALSGEIESIGKNVTQYRVGDRVWAFTTIRFGCYAQRIRLPAKLKLLAPSPANLSHDEVATIPYGGLLALSFIKRAKIQRGENVVIYGASGAIGTVALQLAKHLGAKVTGVCSTANLDLVRSLGADAVLDYTRDAVPTDARYDLVFDAVGRKKTSAMKIALSTALTATGRCVGVDDALPRPGRADLDYLRDLAEAGTLKPVVDRRYSLEDVVEAHRYVELGHKKGNVLLTMAG